MVTFLFEGFCVVECRVVLYQDDGFSFGSVPQTISYWGHQSFPKCSGSSSTSISMKLGLDCQGVGLFVGCQLVVFSLNGLGPAFFVQFLAK